MSLEQPVDIFYEQYIRNKDNPEEQREILDRICREAERIAYYVWWRRQPIYDHTYWQQELHIRFMDSIYGVVSSCLQNFNSKKKAKFSTLLTESIKKQYYRAFCDTAAECNRVRDKQQIFFKNEDDDVIPYLDKRAVKTDSLIDTYLIEKILAKLRPLIEEKPEQMRSYLLNYAYVYDRAAAQERTEQNNGGAINGIPGHTQSNKKRVEFPVRLSREEIGKCNGDILPKTVTSQLVLADKKIKRTLLELVEKHNDDAQFAHCFQIALMQLVEEYHIGDGVADCLDPVRPKLHRRSAACAAR